MVAGAAMLIAGAVALYVLVHLQEWLFRAGEWLVPRLSNPVGIAGVIAFVLAGTWLGLFIFFKSEENYDVQTLKRREKEKT
jgi:hypothetical protein